MILKIIACIIFLFLTFARVLALDLLAAVQKVKMVSPQFLPSIFEHQVVFTIPKQARPFLIPQITVSYSWPRLDYHTALSTYFDFDSYNFIQEGFYPRNRLIELQRQAESLKAQIAEIQANQVRAETNIREQMMRLSALEKEFFKEVESEMAEVERKLLALKDTYSAIKEKLEKTLIRSPEDGIVMNLRIHTLGGVIRPAEPILEIVPQDAELIVEAKLAPAYIENAKVGLSADLRFVALDPRETPVFTDKIFYVFPDAIRDEVNNYYLLRIELDEETLKSLKNLNKDITPGMPVIVVVKTGKRTFLSYLLKPFLDRLDTAFLR